MKKSFAAPTLEMVYFCDSIIATSSCGCFDEFFCPTNYTNCTADGADCECQINHNPAVKNCTPCDNFNG